MSRLFPGLLLPAFCALLPLLPQAHADNWQQNAAADTQTDYLRLEDLRSFYKFTTDSQDRKCGTHTVSNGKMMLVFGPEPRELSIQGYRCMLSHPAKHNERGEFLISKTDVVKLIDPILRPTYITNRRQVKTVVIDPGHGGHDVGQQTPQVREADCMLSLARQLANQLRQRGYEALLTREDNQYLSDQQRVDRANGVQNAIFLSLHLNSGRSDFQGIETYTVTPFTPASKPEETPGQEGSSAAMPGNEQDAANAALAFALQSSLIAASGAEDGACRRARYSLLSSVRCPAAIVELGYATHEAEGAALNTEEYRSTLALALANGVHAFAEAIKPGATPPVNALPPPPPPTPVKVDSPAKDSGKNKAASKKSSSKTNSKRPRAASKRGGSTPKSKRRLRK